MSRLIQKCFQVTGSTQRRNFSEDWLCSIILDSSMTSSSSSTNSSSESSTLLLFMSAYASLIVPFDDSIKFPRFGVWSPLIFLGSIRWVERFIQFSLSFKFASNWESYSNYKDSSCVYASGSSCSTSSRSPITNS